MDFREFKYIQTIAETGSFTRAAAVLYVSQPSLSHMVARIESELGVTLFDRSTKPMTLTYAGEVYLRHAQEILDSNEAMIQTFQQLSASAPEKLVIGMPYDRAAYMLPKIVTMFHQEFPQMKLEVRTGGVPVLTDMLQKGTIQFAVMPIFGEENWMGSTLIYEEELLLAAAPNIIKPSDLLKGTTDVINWECLGEKPFVMQNQGHLIRDAVDLLLQENHITPNVVMSVDGSPSAYRMSTAGLGVCILPQMTTRLVITPGPHYLYRLSDKAPVTWEVRAVYRKDYIIGPLEQRFFDILRDAHQEDNFRTK